MPETIKIQPEYVSPTANPLAEQVHVVTEVPEPLRMSGELPNDQYFYGGQSVVAKSDLSPKIDSMPKSRTVFIKDPPIYRFSEMPRFAGDFTGEETLAKTAAAGRRESMLTIIGNFQESLDRLRDMRAASASTSEVYSRRLSNKNKEPGATVKRNYDDPLVRAMVLFAMIGAESPPRRVRSKYTAAA